MEGRHTPREERDRNIAQSKSVFDPVVYVETPRETPEKITAAAHRQLAENLQLATELGADVVKLEGRDIVAELVRFAREHNVTYVILGHSRRSRWEEFWRGNVINRFISEVGDIDVQVVS